MTFLETLLATLLAQCERSAPTQEKLEERIQVSQKHRPRLSLLMRASGKYLVRSRVGGCGLFASRLEVRQRIENGPRQGHSPS